ncbi:hypothetical protein, partial [Modestobacter versicolor]|uniref:hypothetical protein n=1 Tax=Modestobacter versicolor TaxID=429133 RepID=UPI0034DE4B07
MLPVNTGGIMKIITIGSGNAVRMPKMLFAPNADGSYTKEEVEKLIQEKADASYKAGLEKAKLEKESNELETLRKEKAEREQKDLFDTIKSNLGTDEVKATGVKSFG